METKAPLFASQHVVRICLFLFAAIAMFGGALQMYLGQPETTPRLDNVHRFLAGIYFGCGLTVRQQSTLVLLIGLAVFLAGTGRLVSMSIVGLPEPPAVWLGYLIPELVVSLIMIWAQLATNRRTRAA
jgi:Domain of unknown function (DUF4345)